MSFEIANMIVRVICAGLFSAGLFAAPVLAEPEDMLTAIHDLDQEAVEDLVRDGETVGEEHYLAVLEVASSLSQSQPREVWWRARLMDITGALANQSEPDDATFEALRDALPPDAEGQAAMNLQGSLFVFVATEGRSGDEFERHLAQGADPLLRPERGDYPDMFGYLIHLAQRQREDLTRREADATEFEAAVEHAWNEMRKYAEPPDVARYFLEAAKTAMHERLEYSSEISDAVDDGDYSRVLARVRIDGVRARVLDGLMSEFINPGADGEDAATGEDAETTPLSYAQHYAEAIDDTAPSAGSVTAGDRLHVALGSLLGHAYPDISERVIGEVLAEGADPLASIEYGLVTAHEHRDSFSYLINIAEIAAAREEAGETDHLPDDWRERALRYHDAMASAAEAPDEARYYLERVVGPAHAEEATDEYSAAELAAMIRRDADEVNRAMNDATGDGEAQAEWQKYERDAYGGQSGEIDW